MRTWTDKQLEILRDLYPFQTNEHISKLVDKTPCAVKARALKLGLKKTIKNFGGDTKWTAKEDKILSDNYPFKTSTEIAKMIKRSRSAINQRAKKLKLKLTDEQRTPQRMKTLRKGNIPANKGQKMPAHVYDKLAQTMFKKGHLPHNHKQVGHTRINVDGYMEIKVADPNVFKAIHRVIWEQLNGPIPRGYNIQFKDKDRLNVDPSNLYIINRKNQMKQNTIHNYPPEIRSLIRLTGKLKRKMNDYGEK